MLLRPASTAIITVIRAGRTLASNTIISIVTFASTALAITGTLVRTLDPWMKVVRVDHITYPSEITRACTKGAIRSSPLRLSIKASEALAVAVLLAGAVVAAVVLTQASVAVAALVPGDLPPALDSVRGCRGRGGLTISNKTRTGSREFVLKT